QEHDGLALHHAIEVAQRLVQWVALRWGENSMMSRTSRKVWVRPFCGRTNFSTWSENRHRPTLSLFRIAENPSTAATSAASSDLNFAAVPKRSEALPSTISITVISRSAMNFFT